MSGIGKYKKTIISILVIIIILAIINHFIKKEVSLLEFKAYIDTFGNWVPLILFLVIIITSSVGFVFTIPVAISALTMNLWQALLISVAGLSVGAIISFYLARYIGRDYVERKFVYKIKRLEHFDENLKKNGFLTILLLRFTTLIPYELINIVAGLSRINFVPYFWGTFWGIMPGTLLTIYFFQTTKNVLSTQFILAMVLFTAFALAPLGSKKIRKAVLDI